MPLVEIGPNWKFVAVVFIITLYVTIISFDMLSHWDTKQREDTRLLLLGVASLALLFYSITSVNVPTFVLNVLFIGLLLVAGILASKSNFESDSKPLELYIVAFGSLATLVGAVLWWYIYSQSGQYVREKGKEVREYGKEKSKDINEWREKRRVEKKLRDIERGETLKNEMMSKSKRAGEVTNLAFDPSILDNE